MYCYPLFLWMKHYGMTIYIKPFQEHFGSVPICFHFVADINHFHFVRKVKKLHDENNSEEHVVS